MMTRRPPTISVIVPAFNAEASIDAALESVFAQAGVAFEVIVVNDGSTDGTAARLERWSDRVSVLSQVNGGPGRARNAGILASRGRFVAFLDADDVWLEGKLARQLAYFDRYPDTGLLHTAAATDSATVSSVTGALEAEATEPPRQVFCELFHTDLDINTLTVMMPRTVLDSVGLFDERREVHVEDWDLWLRVAARYPVGYLRQPTAVRRAGGRMSGAVEKTFLGQALVIQKTAALCAASCPRHAGMARECLDRRWHRFHWERGYARLRVGDAAGARASFLSALRHRPLALGTYAQLAGTLMGARLRRLVRRARGVRTPPLVLPHHARQGAHLDPLPFQHGPHVPAAPPPISLVHDTVYRRLRYHLAEHVHDLDESLSRRGDRRRILFQAASPMSFVIFRPVYEKLRADARLEFWFTSAGSTWEPTKLYREVGIDHNVMAPGKATWMKVDACINADFWDTTWLRRRTARLHLFHGVAGKYGLDAPLDIAPIVASYDRLLFPNRDRLERYADAGLVRLGGPEAVLAGYPKLDRLVDGSLDTVRIMADLSLAPQRPTVVYAPTWSPYSSLNLYGEEILRALDAAGFNVIVKLHDRSYDPTPRGSGGVDWAARLEAYRDHPRIRVVTDPDSTPYLAVSDAMVTDHSSVGFEFALLDRPIVVVECPELIAKARINPSKVQELRAAAEVVQAPRDLIAAITRQLDAPALHQAERRALGRRYFYEPGTATDRVAAVVYEVIGLQAPDAGVERAAPRNAAMATLP